MSNNDYRGNISLRFVRGLQARKAPWQKTWAAGELSRKLEFPFNAVNGMAFRGGNALYLMSEAMALGSTDPRWCTAKQAKDNGWKINHSARGVWVEYWKTHDDFQRPDPETGTMTVKRERLAEPEAFYAEVFNASEMEGIPDHVVRPFPKDWSPTHEAERIMQGSGAEFIHSLKDQSQEQAFYAPKLDRIYLHPKDQFAEPLEYYEEALHELCHWSGHATRMNRPGMVAPFGSEAYGREELRAQIASLYVSIELGLPFRAERHLAYFDHWANVIGTDKNELFRASRDAEDIADFVLKQALERNLEKAQSAQAPAPDPLPEQPVVLTSAQMFEHRRSLPHEGGYSSVIKAFGQFAGAIGEDALQVYSRWSEGISGFKERLENSGADSVVASMQECILQGAPGQVVELLKTLESPAAGASLNEAFEWSDRVDATLMTVDQSMDAHEQRIFDCERVGCGEDAVQKARSDLYELRKTTSELRTEPDALIKRLQAVQQRDFERRFDADVVVFEAKPKIKDLTGWMTMELGNDGAPAHAAAYGTPRILDVGGEPPHLKGWEKQVSEIRPTIQASAVQKIIANAEKQSNRQTLTLIAGFNPEGGPGHLAVLKRNANEPAIYVEAPFLQYFLSKYPGAEISSGPVFDQSNPLLVSHQGRSVGVFMSNKQLVRDSAAEIEQYLKRNAKEHAAKPEGPVYVPLDAGQLSSKPTPASISGWMRGAMGDKTVYMTAEVLDLSGDEPAIKDWSKRVNEQRPEVGESTVKRAVERGESNGLVAIAPIAMLVGESKRSLVAFSRKDDEPCVIVDSAYVRYFQHQYSELQYRVGEPLTGVKDKAYPAVQVLHEGELVGVIAPVSVKDRVRTPEQLKGLLSGEMSFVSAVSKVKEKQAGAVKASGADHANGFTKGMPPVAANRLKKALSKEVMLNGKLDTVRGHIERLHSQGDLSLTNVQRPKVAPMSHSAFNAASHAERCDHEARMKKGGKEVVFLVNNRDLGKVAHDYALHLSKINAHEMTPRAAAPAWDEIAAMAEIACDTCDPEILSTFSESFGVGATEYLKMSEVEQRQHLANHLPENEITCPSKTVETVKEPAVVIDENQESDLSHSPF